MLKDSDEETCKRIKPRLEKMASGQAHFSSTSGSEYPDFKLQNISISRCYSCNQVAIWLYDKLILPSNQSSGPEASDDLPEAIRPDFDEARSIIDLSPRGAAALLRLCIQKLCIHLGQPGKNLDDDIAALVKQGLPKKTQQALDIVRVTGNHAVHPGTMDLADNRPTAIKLFGYVNLIVDTLITQPKSIDVVFADLPEGAKAAIKKRDKE